MLSTTNSIPISDVTEIEVADRQLTGRYREKRTEAEKARDLEEISSLYLRGKKASEIADELVRRHQYTGLSAQTIQLELKSLRQMWVQSALINYDEAKAREIARIDELEAAAWDAWNRSWGKQTITVQEGIEDKFGHKGDSDEEKGRKPTTYTRKRGTSTTKERFGDPRYLEKIQWCINERCMILGLHEPTRLAISWKDEATKVGITPEDADSMFNQMVNFTAKALRDKYLKENSLQIPDNILDGEFGEIIDNDDTTPDDED
jgi:hypothetical protein